LTRKNLDFINQQYNKGPVTDGKGNTRIDPSGKPYDPYGKTLQGELDAVRAATNKLIQEIRANKDEYNQDTIIASTSVTYAWLWPFGTIAAGTVMGIYSDRAIKAKQLYEQEESDHLAKLEKQIVLTKCINYVTHVMAEIGDIEKKLENAIGAMEQMKKMFGRLASDLRQIATEMGSADSSLRENDAFLRHFASGMIENSISKWAEVRVLALNFMTYAPIQWLGETAP